MADPKVPAQDGSPGPAQGNATVVEMLHSLEREGYGGEFLVRPDGQVECPTCGTRSPAADLQVDALRRTEGASDPDDMSVVAALRCPVCGGCGALVAKYGPRADLEEAEVLSGLEPRR